MNEKLLNNNNGAVNETNNSDIANYKEIAKIGTDTDFERKIVWKNVAFFAVLHAFGMYGYYGLFFWCKWKTSIFIYTLGTVCALGVTAGSHRYYAHRSYRANFFVQLFLMASFTHMGQNSMYRWVLDHRQHHKYTDTDADPHNATRGFFFSHCGWLMSRPHPAVQLKRRTIDMSDLTRDPLVMFQKRYYYQLYFVLGFLLPSFVPWYWFDETLANCFFTCYCWRYICQLNCTWSVNSFAHLWGTRPYDKTIKPVENFLVSYWANGEGWHNYHHVFPWDYRTSEYGRVLNVTTVFLNFCALFGWTWDMKTVSKDMLANRIKRCGDGSLLPEKILGSVKFEEQVESFVASINLRAI